VAISQLGKAKENDMVDVIGVVTKLTAVTTLESQKTQKILQKRTITLMDASGPDNSGLAVDLTLWGDQAKKYNEKELDRNPVLAIKAVRVSNFGDRSLGATFSSQIFINPDIPESGALRTWFESHGGNPSYQSITGMGGGGGGGEAVRKTLSQVKDDNLGMGPKPDFFSSPATITYFRRNEQAGAEKYPWYLACPNPECKNKKVTEDTDGSVRCDKCGANHAQGVPRYILNMIICDHTGSAWVTAFNDQAQEILGQPAATLLEYKSSHNEAAFEAVFQRAVFQTYNFKIRAKNEAVQEEFRVRCHLVGVSKLDVRQECQTLLNEIDQYKD